MFCSWPGESRESAEHGAQQRRAVARSTCALGGERTSMKVIAFLVVLAVSHFGVLQLFRLTTWHRHFVAASPLLVVYAALVAWMLVKLGLAEFALYQLVLASLWLFIVARHQSRRADAMIELAADASAAQFLAGSFARTKRYYAYSAFIYVGALCISYLVVGAETPIRLPGSSEDPVVRPLVAWLSSLSAASLIAIVGGVYLLIGLTMGADQMSRGVYGAKGPGYTFVAWSLVWPLAAYHFKPRRRRPEHAIRTTARPAVGVATYRSLQVVGRWILRALGWVGVVYTLTLLVFILSLLIGDLIAGRPDRHIAIDVVGLIAVAAMWWWGGGLKWCPELANHWVGAVFGACVLSGFVQAFMQDPLYLRNGLADWGPILVSAGIAAVLFIIQLVGRRWQRLGSRQKL